MNHKWLIPEWGGPTLSDHSYSTGSVSDLTLGDRPLVEAQIAHAPRTVTAPPLT
jgi:hypothetical protein